MHLVSFASTVQKRVVSSTMKAESYQLADVVEAADLMRATLADCHGCLDHSDWETSASQWCVNQWSTDCRSCAETLFQAGQQGGRQKTWNRIGFPLAVSLEAARRAGSRQASFGGNSAAVRKDGYPQMDRHDCDGGRLPDQGHEGELSPGDDRIE